MKYINPQAKLLRHFDRLAKWQAGKPTAPVGVELDLTNRCNLGCEGCHFAYTHSRGPHSKGPHLPDNLEVGDEMDWHLYHVILLSLQQAGVKSLTFSGGGEPTLYPRFKDAVLKATQTYHLPLGLYTNGTLIEKYELADLIKTNAKWVVVSLDHADQQAYLEAKHVNGFHDACNGIRALVGAGGDAVIGVSFLLNAKNWMEIRHMLDVARDLHPHYIEFRPEILYDPARPDEVIEANQDWMKRAALTLWDIEGDDVTVRWDRFDRYYHWSRGYTVCPAVQFTGIITPNGRVWTCVNRRGRPNSLIGDLTQESYAEVYRRILPVPVDPSVCRLMCRGDVLNQQLHVLAQPLPHEEFI